MLLITCMVVLSCFLHGLHACCYVVLPLGLQNIPAMPDIACFVTSGNVSRILARTQHPRRATGLQTHGHFGAGLRPGLVRGRRSFLQLQVCLGIPRAETKVTMCTCSKQKLSLKCLPSMPANCVVASKYAYSDVVHILQVRYASLTITQRTQWMYCHVCTT